LTTVRLDIELLGAVWIVGLVDLAIMLVWVLIALGVEAPSACAFCFCFHKSIRSKLYFLLRWFKDTSVY